MKRKLAVFMAVLSLAVGASLLFGRGWIAQRAFDRAIDRSVGVDQSAALGDGLHVYVCGSGSPLPDAQRAGPCIAVLAGNRAFVFDAGSGSIRKLLRMGFPIEKMQAGFLTHLHSDHFDGLGELLLQSWIGGHRRVPLPVYGPPGTNVVIAAETQLYELDKGFRVAHHGPQVAPPGGYGGTAQVIRLPSGVPSQVVYDQGGVQITAIRVNHAPVTPAFGYRIEYRGRAISISGDTVYSPDFVTASKGVDLMIHDAMNKQMVAAVGRKLAQRGQADTAQIMEDIQGYHASTLDAARAAHDAGARALVLYHLVPAPPSRLIDDLFLGDAPKRFSGPLKLATDGMMISLPAGGKDITFSSAW